MRHEANRAFGVPALIAYVYLTDLSMDSTVYERQLLRWIAKVESNVLLLGSLSSLFRYISVRRLLFERMMFECDGYGMVLLVPVEIIDKWFRLGTLRLICSMEGNLVMAYTVVARVAEVNLAVFPEQDWFLYDLAQCAITVKPNKGSTVGQNVEGVVGGEDGQSVLRPVHFAGYATRGILIALTRGASRQYVASNIE